MARLNIPEQGYKFVETLLELKPETIDAMASTVRQCGVQFSLTKIRAALVEKNVLEKEKADSILREFRRIYIAKQRQSIPTGSFYSEFTRALEENAQDEWKVKFLAKWREAESSISTLFAMENFDIVTKARNLAIEYENVLYNCRIITDIRPVFSGEFPDEDGHNLGIETSVISNILRIDYLDASRNRRQVHLPLDLNDIVRLRQQCDRALRKVEVIRKSLEPLHWSVYCPGIDEP